MLGKEDHGGIEGSYLRGQTSHKSDKQSIQRSFFRVQSTRQTTSPTRSRTKEEYLRADSRRPNFWEADRIVSRASDSDSSRHHRAALAADKEWSRPWNPSISEIGTPKARNSWRWSLSWWNWMHRKKLDNGYGGGGGEEEPAIIESDGNTALEAAQVLRSSNAKGRRRRK